MDTNWKVLMAAAAALAWTLLYSAPSQAGSLAEAAAKERARRQEVVQEKGAARIVTNDDVAALVSKNTEAGLPDYQVSEGDTMAAGDQNQVGAAEKQGDAPQQETVRDAGYWQAERAARENDVARARAEVGYLKRWLASGVSPEVAAKLNADIEAASQKVTAAEERLDRFEDDARVGGALPGWLRETENN